MPWRKTLYTFVFMKAKREQWWYLRLSFHHICQPDWKRNVPLKSTRRHTWHLTELGLLGSFLLDFVPPSDLKCSEEFKEVLESGKYCLVFFLGSWGLARTASLCLCHLPPEERRLVIATEVSELLGVGWGSGLLVKCRQLQRENTKLRHNPVHRITPEWILIVSAISVVCYRKWDQMRP